MVILRYVSGERPAWAAQTLSPFPPSNKLCHLQMVILDFGNNILFLFGQIAVALAARNSVPYMAICPVGGMSDIVFFFFFKSTTLFYDSRKCLLCPFNIFS